MIVDDQVRKVATYVDGDEDDDGNDAGVGDVVELNLSEVTTARSSIIEETPGVEESVLPTENCRV